MGYTGWEEQRVCLSSSLGFHFHFQDTAYPASIRAPRSFPMCCWWLSVKGPHCFGIWKKRLGPWWMIQICGLALFSLWRLSTCWNISYLTCCRTVFTHADIAPRNIMIDEQNKVTGILDWEYAGWYPDYWEYAQRWDISMLPGGSCFNRPVFWRQSYSCPNSWTYLVLLFELCRVSLREWDLRFVDDDTGETHALERRKGVNNKAHGMVAYIGPFPLLSPIKSLVPLIRINMYTSRSISYHTRVEATWSPRLLTPKRLRYFDLGNYQTQVVQEWMYISQ